MTNPQNNPPKTRGRPISFDRKHLITQVMYLLWEHGYNALSLNEIASDTGLTRASLYNSFGSKDALLLEAITLYITQSPDIIYESPTRVQSACHVFHSYLDTLCIQYTKAPKHRGCLAIQCFHELATEDTPLAKSLKKLLNQRMNGIFLWIQHAIQNGEIPASTDAKTTANMIITFISGLSVFSKGGAQVETLKDMSHLFLNQIGFQRP